jgi:hypothetical protein
MTAQTNTADPLEKIRSQELRREAREAGITPHTVVIEIDLPQPQVDLDLERTTFGAPRFRLTESEADPAEVERQISKARRLIERIIGRPTTNFLPSSGSFIVKASGEQLRKIARLSSVLAIWPNSLR